MRNVCGGLDKDSRVHGRSWFVWCMSCRLVLARRHLMAYRVSEMLGGAGKDEVLLHWAAAKISASPSVPDGSLKAALAAKISLMDRPKYAPLAAHAQVRPTAVPQVSCIPAKFGAVLECCLPCIFLQRAPVCMDETAVLAGCKGC